MKRALTKNWGLKLLAFVFSVLLWIIVMNIEDPVDERTFSGIQVTVTHPEIVTNPGNTYQILDDSRTVSVTVKAKRSILNKIKTDDIRATADMKNLDVRTRSLIPIDISIPSYAGRFEATANPINLRVSIELGKSETFPITATSSGTPRDGYQVGELKANPEKIKISGPESVIDSIDKVVALVDVSGQSKDEEKEAIKDEKEYQVGIDALTIAVNPENPVTGVLDDLSTEQIVSLFSGKYATWKDLDPSLPDEKVVVITRDINGGAHEVFQKNIMGDTEVSSEAIQASSMGELVQDIIDNKYAIGYASFGVANQNAGKVVTLKVNGVEPTKENIIDGSYIIQRPLLIVGSGDPTDVQQAFLDVILGETGQKTVEDMGFIPMK